MKESILSCFICGEDNPNVIEEHHKLPRRYGGPDKKINLLNLCANCHRAIESAYNNEFWEFSLRQIQAHEEFGMEDLDIGGMKKEIEDELTTRMRYELIKKMRKTGLTNRKIANLIDEFECLDSITAQRVGQLAQSNSFEDEYNGFGDGNG